MHIYNIILNHLKNTECENSYVMIILKQVSIYKKNNV